MTTGTVELSFGALLRAALDSRDQVRSKLPPEVFTDNNGLGTLKLPTVGEAAIPGQQVQTEPSYGRVEWLASSGVPILDRLTTLTVQSRKGVVPIGGDLPSAAMVGEFSNTASTDPSITGHAFTIASFVEANTQVSTQALMQSREDLLDALQEALRLSIAETLLKQVVAGTGQGSSLEGIPMRTGIQTGTYAMADRGADRPFTDAETKVEDASGMSSGWVLGKDLSTAARATLIEPGSDRRVEERGRLSLSGTPAYRDGSIAAKSGLCADWQRAVVLVLEDEIEYTLNRVSKPGMLSITARLGVSLLVVRPKLVYLLTEA